MKISLRLVGKQFESWRYGQLSLEYSNNNEFYLQPVTRHPNRVKVCPTQLTATVSTFCATVLLKHDAEKSNQYLAII
jgi:hypothetical protein